MTITFEVPGVPVAQPRQRHRVAQIHGRSVAMNYTPTKHPVNAWKATIQLAARQAYQGAPINGPVTLVATCVFPRPQNRIWKTRPMPREPKTGKPDGDNVGKALKDALSGLIFRDDALVWDERIVRYVAAGDEQPHTVVVIQVDDQV